MKIKITEKKHINKISFDKLPIGKAFINIGGSLCIKFGIDEYINFDSITELHYSFCATYMVEPVEIDSIEVKLIKGGRCS